MGHVAEGRRALAARYRAQRAWAAARAWSLVRALAAPVPERPPLAPWAAM